MAINYVGSNNKVSTTFTEKTELYQKIFKGEVLEQWQNQPVLAGLTTVKPITNGSSHEFKNSGSAGWSQQYDGVELDGQDNIGFSRTVVVVEPRITSIEKVTEMDSAMNDFNERSVIKNALLSALSNKEDSDKIREIVLGSQATSGAVTGTPGGLVVKLGAGFDALATQAKGDKLIEGIFAGKNNYVKKNVKENAFVLVGPDEYSVLEQNDRVQNAYYNETANGGLDKGGVLKIGSIFILQSNNLDGVDYSGEAYHAVNLTNTRMVMFTMSSIATVKLINLDTRFVDRKDAFASKIITSYVEGHKFLRPECSISFEAID